MSPPATETEGGRRKQRDRHGERQISMVNITGETQIGRVREKIAKTAAVLFCLFSPELNLLAVLI